MGEVTVKLSKRYEAHGVAFDQVVLREPTFGEYFEIGEPQEAVYGGAARMLQTDFVTVRRYLDKLTVSPEAGSLDVIDSLADVMALKDAVLGFFTQARELLLKPTSSSSGSAGDRKTSTD